jgi:hypothetical protein
MSSAERVRASRDRAKRGRRIVKNIEIADELPLALVDAGFLREWTPRTMRK